MIHTHLKRRKNKKINKRRQSKEGEKLNDNLKMKKLTNTK